METVRISINPDNDKVQEIKKQLKENGGYCPCKIEKIPDNKCICKEFRQQKYGECHCGLYIKHKRETN